MKRIKLLGLLAILMLTCSCASKYEGTWCKFADIDTSLVILSLDIEDDKLNAITSYVETIEDLKSYDVINKIEESSKMVTIYYKKEDNIKKYEDTLKGFDGVKEVKTSKVNTVVDKLKINNDRYVFDKDLDDFKASEVKGIFKEDGNTIILEDNTKFYYKNKFLCYDADCNNILTKSKNDTCN